MRLGLLTDEEVRTVEARLEAEERVRSSAETATIGPEAANPILERIGSSAIRESVRVAELAKRPGVSLGELLTAAAIQVSDGHAEWASIELRYEGYLARERDAAARLAELDSFVLPEDLEYVACESLSYEAREKLAVQRPRSLGEAGRVPGVSPSDLQNLVIEVLKRRGSVA
jgi:tRNA uridine 5-carboxymethylaminomethyl modification enzyme